MRKTVLSTLILFLTFIIFVTGCTRKEIYPEGAVVIKLWTPNNPYEINWADSVVKAWNESHPNIFVSAQPIPEGRSSEEILMASVLAKTTPDICANLSPTLVERFRKAGALVALNDLPALMNALLLRVPEEPLKDFISPDGRLYQIPWKCNPIAMFCNMGILEKCGVKPPVTYSEWMNGASLLRKSLPGMNMAFFDTSITWHKRFFDFYTLYIAASGGKTLLNKKGEPDIVNPAARKVMEFLQANFQNKYVPLEITPGDPFTFQRVAVNISGPWNVAALKQDADFINYDVFPVPVPDDYQGDTPPYTFSDPKCIGIFSTTKHPVECAEFAAFMCNRSNDAQLVRISSQLVYRKDLQKDPLFIEIFKKTPVLEKFARLVPKTRSIDNSPQIMELFDALSMEYVDIAVRRLRTADEGLKRAEARMREIIE